MNDIVVRQGRYAPGTLLLPRSEVVYWTPVRKDGQGNQTVELACAGVVEVRFAKPAASPNFHITLRAALGADGAGDEWTIVVPAERLGILFVPQGFTAEQSVMGAVYRLAPARDVRVLADQIAGMPGLNFTLQLV